MINRLFLVSYWRYVVNQYFNFRYAQNQTVFRKTLVCNTFFVL